MANTRNERKSNRTIATAAVAALVVAGGSLAFALGGGAQAEAKTTALPAGASGAQSAATIDSASRVRVVKAFEQIDVGRDNSMWVSSAGSVATIAPGANAYTSKRPMKTPQDPKGLFSVWNFPDKTGTLYTGFYRGPGKVTKVTVQTGNTTLSATIVTLAGNPTKAAFYANGPVRGAKPPAFSTITVYAANGATLTKFKLIE